MRPSATLAHFPSCRALRFLTGFSTVLADKLPKSASGYPDDTRFGVSIFSLRERPFHYLGGGAGRLILKK